MTDTALTIERTPQVIATEINSIKKQAQAIFLQSCIEIGRRLVEAKSLVQHGEWERWLESSVDYSQRTASNLMRIYEEYGNAQISLFDGANQQALADLGYTQAVALLGIPAEERVEFVEQNDVANMSTRDLQRIIKERDEALSSAANEISRIAEERDKAREAVASLDKKNMANIEQLKNLQRSAKALEEELQKEQARARDASPEKVKQLQGQLKAAQAQVEELTAELNKPVTMEAAVIEKVLEEVQQELDALREKQKNGDQKAAAQLKFRIIFDVIVKDIGDILAALEDIKKTAPPKEYEKYENAVLGLAEKMVEKV